MPATSHENPHEFHEHEHHNHSNEAHEHEHPHEHSSEHKHGEKVEETSRFLSKKSNLDGVQDSKNLDKKAEDKKKTPAKSIIKKEEAFARGLAMHASKKHCMYICTFIKNKPVDQAILDLEQVIKFKKPIPFKGEIPHRKGKGIMAGRYPIKTSALFIKLLKGLKGNILINGLEPERTRIYFAMANWASRPARREGRKAKRTNVLLKAKEISGEKK